MTTALAPAVPAMRWRRVLAVAVLTGLGVALLAGLGWWQVQRRAWKLDLIRKADARVQAPVHPIPAAASVDPSRFEYEHIQIAGSYLTGADTWVHASTDRGSGYWVLSPLRATDGALVLVNRGFVPVDVARRDVTVGSSLLVTGLLRASEPGAPWPRRNDPSQDRWYSRDVRAIAIARGLKGVAPYFIDADAAPVAASAERVGVGQGGLVEPVAGLTVVHFRNEHLSYAVTWFTLASMTLLAGIFVIRGEVVGYPHLD